MQSLLSFSMFKYKREIRIFGVVVLYIQTIVADLIVDTNYGKVQGVRQTDSNAFLGIPYAKPPVNELRWERPQFPLPWKPAVYDATTLKPGCPQDGCLASNPAFVCPNETSESCLYLNIWTPANASSGNPIPVMVYLHGGNFVHMSSSSPLYKGDVFAARGHVVLVTVDYRLGAFGFLYTGPEMGDAEGNYGIRDQLLALQWVHENIINFGGDPNKVTLFGQSAGAQSIVIHLMTPDSTNLFRNVIIESSPFDIPFKSPLEALYLARIIKTLLNCTNNHYMTCLRSKTADEIAAAQLKSRAKPTSLKLLEFFEPLGPYVDGKIVPLEPIYAIQNNKVRSVPTMIGTVSEETRVFIYEAWGKPVKPTEYITVLFATFPTRLNEIIQMYPPSNTSDTRDELSNLGTDFIFTCAARNMSRNFVKQGTDVYKYVFDHAFSFQGWGNLSFCENHVCHGEEIVFVFHSADNSGFSFDQEEEILSYQMIYYWSNFAYTSNPSQGPHNVTLLWPKYNPFSSALKFQTPSSTIVENYNKKFCDFWDTIGYKA